MDPIIGASAISALANLGGGFMSAAGAAQANANNMAINQQNQWFQNNVNNANWEHQQAVNAENWAHSQAMANYNFDFAREMATRQEQNSNTAYQRAVQDMRAAGINPMLAYVQGGASTPAGMSASGSTVGSDSSSSSGSNMSPNMTNTQAELGRALGRAASSAVETYKMGQESRLTQQRTKTEEAGTTQMENLSQRTAQETSNAATQGHNLQADWQIKQEQIKTERERQAAYRAQSAAGYAHARQSHAGAALDELRHREARPTSEGGHGRGTGVGPNTIERFGRQIEDLGTFGIQ